MSEISELKKIVLENAYKYNGKADQKRVFSQILGQMPKYRENTSLLLEILTPIVTDVNNLDLEQQKEELLKLGSEVFEKKEETTKRDIFSFIKLKDATKIKTCFPPGPEKYFHIGHSKAIFLNYLFAEKYGGEFYLRFEDTNPKLVKPEFYKIMQEDIEWLGIKPSNVIYASDYIELLKEMAIKLIEKEKAYVCFCDSETISKNREKKEACKCRNKTIDENLKEFKEMDDFPEGKATLRLKIDLSHKNTRMRDPTIFRIIDAKHPRIGDKHRNYPTYDFQNAVLDGYFNTTHRFRTVEFEMASELHHYIRKELGLYDTFTYEFARFNLKGMESSGRVIREKVNSGELIGWDDPSLPTLRALKRRGFCADAIKQLVIETGITKNSGTEITWDTLIKYNKRILNSSAKRYFFIENAKEIKITNDPMGEYSLKIHPNLDLGLRPFRSVGKYFVEKEDYDSFIENNLIRLMDHINFRKNKEELEFVSNDYLDFKKELAENKKIIHFLPADKEQLVKITIFTPDHKIIEGIAEKNIESLKIGEVIQFERFGFCRLDSITTKENIKKYNFWFTH
jgi:glutamyl-tRNA synthetase